MTGYVTELYGIPTSESTEWPAIVAAEHCPFLNRRCVKTRKSTPELTIGTCSVRRDSDGLPIIICPHRLLERRQIFVDAIHLLKNHEPGNHLHLLSEFRVPGGNVDFLLVSVDGSTIADFVGIELQTLDTTGTVWPARERLLADKGVTHDGVAVTSRKSYGFNWKMTAKTILMQLHHKLLTFESVGKKLVLVIQQPLMEYMESNFSFGHLSSPASLNDSLHFHPYHLSLDSYPGSSLKLAQRHSTNDAGMVVALGLQADAHVDLAIMNEWIGPRITDNTRFNPLSG